MKVIVKMAKQKKWEGPGSIYKNGSRYWWKVRIPGEVKTKARPLIPQGSTKATNNYDIACIVAQDILNHAVFKENQKNSQFDGSLANLINIYLTYCRERYSSSNEAYNIEVALRPLPKLYPDLPAEEFDSLKLMTVQDYLIKQKLARSTINKRRIPMIKRMFKWAVSRKLVPGFIFTNLSTVESIERGRHGVKPEKKVTALPEKHVIAILPYLTSIVADMVMVHYYTGLRSTEICIMKPADFDKESHKNIWIYKCKDKNFWRTGELKQIPIGPKTQKILKKYMKRQAKAYLFSPAESMAKMREKRRENRTTKDSYGNRPGTNIKSNPLVQPNDRYNKDSYRRAVQRGIAGANKALRIELKLKKTDTDPIPKWTPHQLRHTASTNVRADMGLDAASAMLGHSDINTTQLYAELQLKKAIEAAEKHG
ncbi:MAG: site-specific integrase [Phycisphaerae bacterium]|nr:site-specific integrase [Phycisphaerae bacterium]